MVARPLMGSQLLLFLTDRGCRDEDGNLAKNLLPMTLQSSYPIPLFKDESMTAQEVFYTPVACVTHIGDDINEAGHYRALMKVRRADGLQSCSDDDMEPVEMRNWPNQISQGIMLIWMCRNDMLALPPMELKHTESYRAMTAVIHKLQHG